MACVDIVKTSKGTRIFYDLDAAVGRGGMNARPDVLLVQYLLKDALREPTLFAAHPWTGGPIPITGSMDATTQAAIIHFQTVAHARSATLSTVDGRVDPVPGTGTHGTITGTQYPILNLNMAFSRVRPGDLPKLADLPDCPAELRPALKVEFVSPT